MSTALSHYCDFSDVIQQNKQRPVMLELRQRAIDRKPNNLLISRRHSTNSTNMSSLASPSFLKQHGTLSPSSSSFYPMQSSPKEAFLNGIISSGVNIRDRAQSASYQEDLEAQHRKRNATNSSRYKTELCRPFEENGTCKYGDKCQFAHGEHEVRGLNRHPKYKTEYCRTYHTIGFCPYGPRCHFIHDEEKEKRPMPTATGRSCSISSMDSTPSSPALDHFNSLTPPTSPGYGEDVFLFDDSTSHVPSLSMNNHYHMKSVMTTIPENSHSQYTRSVSVSSYLPKTQSTLSSSLSVPHLADDLHEINSKFQPIRTKIDEQPIMTPSDSGSSNPPSPTDSVDGSNRRRLPVFGSMKQ